MNGPGARTVAAAAAFLFCVAAHLYWPAVVVAVAAVLVWLARLRLYPRGPCFGCRGRRGRNPGSDENQFGDCRLCKGSGERVRLGAQWVRPDLRKGK